MGKRTILPHIYIQCFLCCTPLPRIYPFVCDSCHGFLTILLSVIECNSLKSVISGQYEALKINNNNMVEIVQFVIYCIFMVTMSASQKSFN